MTNIVIVAHEKRRTMAEHLADQVSAEHTSWDDGTLGCSGNHRRAWEWHHTNTAEHFAVVLEDDAVPIDNFRQQLEQALTAAPTDIVSLYLGRSYPIRCQANIQRATNAADQTDAHWITADRLFHAVGVAIRTTLVNDMLGSINQTLPIDDAITEWAHRRRILVGYTWPSIIDHRDQPTVIPGHRRTKPRKAWRVGTRGKWDTPTVTYAQSP